jgi:hypothetical protein
LMLAKDRTGLVHRLDMRLHLALVTVFTED